MPFLLPNQQRQSTEGKSKFTYYSYNAANITTFISHTSTTSLASSPMVHKV